MVFGAGGRHPNLPQLLNYISGLCRLFAIFCPPFPKYNGGPIQTGRLSQSHQAEDPQALRGLIPNENAKGSQVLPRPEQSQLANADIKPSKAKAVGPTHDDRTRSKWTRTARSV